MLSQISSTSIIWNCEICVVNQTKSQVQKEEKEKKKMIVLPSCGCLKDQMDA